MNVLHSFAAEPQNENTVGSQGFALFKGGVTFPSYLPEGLSKFSLELQP